MHTLFRNVQQWLPLAQYRFEIVPRQCRDIKWERPNAIFQALDA